MAKYRVYAIAAASWLLGEYEAESEGEAKKMADHDQMADVYKSLCHQCSEEIELGDCYETQADKV